MKDLVIPARRLVLEARVLVGCLVLAWLINAGAIIAYRTKWTELLSAWPVTLGLALALYVVFALLRLSFAGLQSLFRPANR